MKPFFGTSASARCLAALIAAASLVASAAAPKPAPSKAAPPKAPARPTPAVTVPTVFGFKAPISEGNRTIALVSGKEARPSLLAGQVQIIEFRLETYRYAPDKETEIIVESPLGVFGGTGADSDRTISLRSADGRFTILGEGWGWNRTTGLLVISNRVATTLRRPGVATNRPPIGIHSQRFEYNLRTGDARFVGNCEAVEPDQARIRAGELASRLSAKAERPDAITATNDVVLEILRPGRPGQATGRGAVYRQSEKGDRIELLGPATWKFAAGEGSADELVLLPAQDAYSARGHARLILSWASSTNATTTAASAAPSVGSSPLEITAESIEGNPKEIVFTGPVTAFQGTRLQIRAGRVVANFDTAPAASAESRGAAPRPTRITATDQVHALIGTAGSPIELEGGRMLYSLGEHDVIEVLDQPSWKSAAHQGRAERFVIHPQVPSFQAVDRVRVAWSSVGTGTSTNAVPIDLTADRLVVEPTEARFSGAVRIQRPTWTLESSELNLGLTTNSVPSGFAAKGGVTLDYQMPAPTHASSTNAALRRPLGGFSDPTNTAARHWKIRAAEVQGQLAAGSTNAEPASLDATGGVRIESSEVTATGGRLAYRGEDGLVRLTENAHLQTSAGLEIVGEPGTALTVEPKSGRFSVDGRWKRMTLPALALRGAVSTNMPARH